MTTTKKPAPKKKPAAKPAPVSVPDGNRWHMIYTPVWRSQLDYGVEIGLIPAHETIAAKIAETVSKSWEWREKHGNEEYPVIALNWEQASDTQLQASGSDGITETTLVIATLTRVG